MGFLLLLILIIGDVFFPPSGIPLFTILYFGWKYIKLKIKMDIYLSYLLFFGIPQVALFFLARLIALPFKESFGVLKWVEDKLESLESGVDYVQHHFKKSLVGAVISLLILFPVLSPMLSQLPGAALIIPEAGVTSFSARGALIMVVLSLLAAFFPVVLIATIVNYFKDRSGGGESGSESRLDSMYTSPGASAVDQYKQQNQKPQRPQNNTSQKTNIEEDGLFARIKKWFAGCVPENVKSVGAKLMALNPVGGDDHGEARRMAKSEIASEAAEVGYETYEGAEATALAPLIAFGAILLLIQVGIIFALFGFIVKIYMPLIGGPMLAALGFTTDYATYGGQVLAPYMPEIDLEPVVLMVQGPIAKAQCFFKGPQCFSEWQMNNTQRPGSEEAGQTYDLTASGFEIEQGQTIDAAYQRPSRPLSVAFALENPRYGLKGISARDVQYKVAVRNNAGDEICGTDFLPISFYQDSSIDSTTIPPGDSYAVGVGTNEEELENSLNLFECRLLQPGQAKLTRTAELAFMYDYASQSNLRLRAMSYENFADRDLDRGYKKSETADTPVKSFVNVYAPVLFDEMDDGERNARPFEVQIGLQTDDPDVRYRVDPTSIRFTPSRSTEIVDGSCGDFTTASTGPGGVETYKLDNPGVRQIRRETTDVGRWYTSARSPSVMECTMKIANPEDISASGETLILDVSANYTVIKDGVTDDFQTWNTLCSGRNCPFLVPQQALSGQSDSVKNNFITTCDPGLRATAVGGCDVREPGIDYTNGGTDIQSADDLDEDAWVNGLGGDGIINYEKVNEGETAYDWNYFVQEGEGDSMKDYAYLSTTGGRRVIGLTESNWDAINGDADAPPKALYVRSAGTEKDTEFREITWRTVCGEVQGSSEAAVDRFAQIWESKRSIEKLLFLKPATAKESCAPTQGFWGSLVQSALTGQDQRDRYNNVKESCEEENGVLTVLQSGSYSCYS